MKNLSKYNKPSMTKVGRNHIRLISCCQKLIKTLILFIECDEVGFQLILKVKSHLRISIVLKKDIITLFTHSCRKINNRCVFLCDRWMACLSQLITIWWEKATIKSIQNPRFLLTWKCMNVDQPIIQKQMWQ